MPGAWLQTPAKTRLMAQSPVERRQCSPDIRACIQAGSHRTILALALAHGLDVGAPLITPQRRIVHEDLPIHPHDVEQAHVGRANRAPLLIGQLVLREEPLDVFLEATAHGRVAIELEEELLRIVQTHRDDPLLRRFETCSRAISSREYSSSCRSPRRSEIRSVPKRLAICAYICSEYGACAPMRRSPFGSRLTTQRRRSVSNCRRLM